MNDADNNAPRPRSFAQQTPDDTDVNHGLAQPRIEQRPVIHANAGIGQAGVGQAALKELEELERQLRALSAFQAKPITASPANAAPRTFSPTSADANNPPAADPSARQSALRALLESRGVSAASQQQNVAQTRTHIQNQPSQQQESENVKKSLLSVWEQAEADVLAKQHAQEQQRYVTPQSADDHLGDKRAHEQHASRTQSSSQVPYPHDHEEHAPFVMRGSLSDDLEHNLNEDAASPEPSNTVLETPESDVSLFEARLRENMQALQDRDLALETERNPHEQHSASPVVERIVPQALSGFSLKPLIAPSQFSANAQPFTGSSHVEGLNSEIPVPQPPVMPTPPLLRTQNNQSEASHTTQNGASKQALPPHSATLSSVNVPEGERQPPQVKRSEPVRSRRRLLMIAASVVASIIGLASFNAWRGLSTSTKTGDVPIIKADQNPTRIQPQNPGGLDIPNQNKQIYEKPSINTNGSQARIVDNEEQPVDLQQAVRSQGNAAPNTDAQSPLGEPRKVRTITIRPDGAAQTEQAVVPPPPPAAKVMPPVKTVVNKPAEQKQQPVSTRAAQPPQRPVENTIEQAIADIPPSPEPTVITPIPTRTPPERSNAEGQKIQQRLSAVNTAPAPVPDVAAGERSVNERSVRTASIPNASSGNGDFGVQLAAPGSEKEAQSLFSDLQKRHSALSGYSPVVRQATVGERTIYRLRVGAMSRDEATALCTRLKASGGQCFVTKN